VPAGLTEPARRSCSGAVPPPLSRAPHGSMRAAYPGSMVPIPHVRHRCCGHAYIAWGRHV